MDLTQAFLLGVMVAWTPSLIVPARQLTGPRDQALLGAQQPLWAQPRATTCHRRRRSIAADRFFRGLAEGSRGDRAFETGSAGHARATANLKLASGGF